MLGTNPIAFAMPAEPVDFAFDAATTVVPRGKLEVYRDHEKPLPNGWAIDSGGHSSTDAAKVLDAIIRKEGGGIAPLGGAGDTLSGYKGYGFAAIVEICTAVLSGGLTANRVSVKPGEAAMCHAFCALDYGLFGDKKAQKAALSTYLAEIRNSHKAEGQPRIYTHGERALEAQAQALKEGIPIGEKTLVNIERLGKKFGISL
jgi:LDH2 family malate/lactate/ureidoglycolate dehydrogenase